MTKKKSKLDSLTTIDAKQDKFEPTTLDQIWGDSGISKYNTMELNKYEQSLSEMSKTDLREHAVKVGLFPVDNREILVKRLVAEFRKHVASFTKPIKKQKELKISKKAMDILKEGS